MEPKTDELLARLTAELLRPTDEVEPGFKTRAKWQEEWGCSHGHAQKLLDAGLKKGLIEMRRFRVRYLHGFKTVPHYRPTFSGKKSRQKGIV